MSTAVRHEQGLELTLVHRNVRKEENPANDVISQGSEVNSQGSEVNFQGSEVISEELGDHDSSSGGSRTRAGSDDSAGTNIETKATSVSGSSETKVSAGTGKAPRARRKRSRINIAPLNTPLKRRLQTFSVMWHTISIPMFCCIFLFVLSLGSLAWVFVVLPYFVWFYGIDLHTPTNGKVVYRVKDWMRNLILWEWFVDYFPIRVYKTCELEPTFTTERVEVESPSDDEEDLVSEHSRTFIDKLFKLVGLRKRLNDLDSWSSAFRHLSTDSDGGDKSDSSRTTHRYKRVSTGPRYIFGYHPHGVISMGVMGLFATNSLRNEPFEPPLKCLKSLFHDPSKGKQLFPGVGYVFPLTLTTQFTLPFFRDYLLSLGLTSASAKNIKSIINNGDNSVCIVVGGAQESLLNDVVGKDRQVGIGYKDSGDDNDDGAPVQKKQIRLVLNKRKGFVKLAIEIGNVSLVPTFAFGEADIYKLSRPPPGSYGYAFQQWMKRTFHFTLPFFSARGVFIYDFGFLPYRTPINIVTGRPIYVPPGVLLEELTSIKSTSPQPQRQRSLTNLLSMARKKKPAKRHVPKEVLDHYHRLYVEEVKRIFEENKNKFGYDDVELIIIE